MSTIDYDAYLPFNLARLRLTSQKPTFISDADETDFSNRNRHNLAL